MTTTTLTDFAALRAAVLSVLEHSRHYPWTTQGFGMARTYLDRDKRWRLNIWDDRLAVPNVSLIHDHPWSFRSYVLAGQITNRRYNVSPVPPFSHNYVSIRTGEGGGPVDAEASARLYDQASEVYRPGDSYEQRLDEVHETQALRGTVTLNDRTQPTAAYTARVFWPLGQRWVDAEPKPAVAAEVEAAVAAALEAW